MSSCLCGFKALQLPKLEVQAPKQTQRGMVRKLACKESGEKKKAAAKENKALQGFNVPGPHHLPTFCPHTV